MLWTTNQAIMALLKALQTLIVLSGDKVLVPDFAPIRRGRRCHFWIWGAPDRSSNRCLTTTTISQRYFAEKIPRQTEAIITTPSEPRVLSGTCRPLPGRTTAPCIPVVSEVWRGDDRDVRGSQGGKHSQKNAPFTKKTSPPAALRDRQACKRPPDSEMGNLFANLGGNEQKETS